MFKNSTAKLIITNILIFIGLMFFINIMAFIALRLDFQKPSVKIPAKKRAINYDLLKQENSTIDYKALFYDMNHMETEYVPFLIWRKKPYKGKVVTINKKGERIHDEPQRAKSSAATVRFFGGSTIWGYYAKNNGSIPALYNIEFNPNKRVYNHGDLGYTSRQSLAKLINLINTNSPIDDVVFYDGGNDIATYCHPMNEVNSNMKADMMNEIMDNAANHRKISHRVSVLNGIKSLFAGYTIDFINQWKENKASAQPSNVFNTLFLLGCVNNGPRVDTTAQYLINNWRMANELVSTQGGRFYAILQPLIYIGNPVVFEEFDMREDVKQAYIKITDIIKNELKDEEWFYDFTTVFDLDYPVFVDEIHVIEKGNRIIADKINQIIQERNRNK